MKKRHALRIEYTTLFEKQRKKAPLEVKIAFRETLGLFLEEPNNSILRNHALKKKFAGHRSIDVTEDWRAIFTEFEDKRGNKTVRFKFLGTHDKLYKR